MNRLSLFALAVATAATPVLAQSGPVTIPASVQSAVGRILPEGSNAGAAYLGADYSPNLIVTAPCQVRVVFFWESAGYRNSLGWFRYQDTGDTVEILETGMVFPDVRQPQTISPGDTAWLTSGGAARTFQAGDHVGFFLVADGWNRSAEVRNWVDGASIPTSSPLANRSIGRGCYTTLPALNPESILGDGSRAQHVAMVRIPGVAGFLGGGELIVCGFEDLDRTVNSDDDFNDAVFLFEVTPATAIDSTVIAQFDPNDNDGDGLSGFDDAYPDDGERAFVQRIPQHGWSVMAFEDLYPAIGDADYNDAVVAVAYTLISDKQNHVKDVIADFHLLARGASYDHEFGLNLHKLPPSVSGTVRMQHFASGAPAASPPTEAPLVVTPVDGARIRDVFASTQQALPRAVPQRPFANTWPGDQAVQAASVRVWIAFDAPVATALLGTAPFDPYLFVQSTQGQRADIHMPGYASFTDRSAGLPAERGNRSFLDSEGNPWAIVVPTNWRYPLESVPITVAYPEFSDWRDSRGRRSLDWYLHPTAEAGRLSGPIEDMIPARAWTLRGPGERF